MSRAAEYDDGLDADGYPISEQGGGFRYVHGEEEDFEGGHIGKPLDDAWLSRLAFAAELSRHTESPIETMMGLALHDVFRGYKIEIVPQFQWRRYRVDWAIRRPGKPLVFVECDGAEFHTKPADVARDQVRDVAADHAGIKTFRFTGSEIYASAQACALVVRNGMTA